MTAIVPLILQQLKTHLDAKLRLEIPSNDPSRVAEVKIGKFQDDPLKTVTYVALSPGDPDRSEWVDGIVTLESMRNIGFYVDPREIGGGQVWWRRGVAKLGAYYIKDRYEEEDALLYAYTALSRLLYYIPTVDLNGVVDEFNERAVLMFAYQHSFAESGGPPNQYIWRGAVQWQCLTEKP